MASWGYLFVLVEVLPTGRITKAKTVVPCAVVYFGLLDHTWIIKMVGIKYFQDKVRIF